MAVVAISGELLLLGVEKGNGTEGERKVSFRSISDILVFKKRSKANMAHVKIC